MKTRSQAQNERFVHASKENVYTIGPEVVEVSLLVHVIENGIGANILAP